MQRQHAEFRFNLQPIICPSCKEQQPNYRFLLVNDSINESKLLCSTCIFSSQDLISSIKIPFKDYYHNIIKKLPLPDYRIAKSCISSVQSLKIQVQNLIAEIRKKIDCFESDLGQFFEQTMFICQGYMDKVNKIQESSLEGWHKVPPKLIDQQQYILNIKQKQQIAFKIQQSLKQLKVSIPNINQIKSQLLKSTQKVICKNISINVAINIRGLLYLGTNNGQIIYQDGFQFKEIQAHAGLIRAFQHDGQFRLFSGSDDYSIKIWNLRCDEPTLMKVLEPGNKSYHRQLALVQGGKSLASSRGQFDQYKIRLWDLQSLTNTKTLSGHTGFIRGMIANDKNEIISTSQDRYLKIWDLKTCEISNEYFHNCKILHVFQNSYENLICIVDELNKVVMLDHDQLFVINGLYLGKKIQMASGQSFIYVHIERYLMVYNWKLCLVEKINLGSNLITTAIIQMGSRLVITDGHGVLRQYSPNCLKNH